MKAIIFLAAIACTSGCGSAKKSDQQATSAAPSAATLAAVPCTAPEPREVTRLNIDGTCFVGASCGTTITATYSDGGSVLSAPYSLTISMAEGAVAPPACDAASKSGNIIQFLNLKPATLYTFRGCVFDGKVYSSGTPVPFTTGGS